MKRFDVPLVVITLVLVAVGMVVVGSASWFVSQEEYGDPFHYLTRQGFAVALGFVAMTVCAYTPYRKLQKLAPSLYGAALMALVMVWVPGISHHANGATRWFRVAGISFQPAEMAKLVVMICLATWFERNRGNIHDPRVLVRAGLGLLPVTGLILAQPDFGSTAIILGLSGLMVFLAGLRWAWFMSLVAVGSVGLGTVMVAESYRMARLASFMDPCATSASSGYQVCQALVAIHHGGLFGQGLGDGQAKLLFLPEPHNDFIVAVLGEELGLVGMLGLFVLYGLLAWRGIVVATRAVDTFGAMLATTFTVMLVGQACLNLGVALSIVPPKGLVLPFMSYGATAMMVNLAAVGILLSISAEGKEEVAVSGDGRPEGTRSRVGNGRPAAAPVTRPAKKGAAA